MYIRNKLTQFENFYQCYAMLAKESIGVGYSFPLPRNGERKFNTGGCRKVVFFLLSFLSYSFFPTCCFRGRRGPQQQQQQQERRSPATVLQARRHHIKATITSSFDPVSVVVIPPPPLSQIGDNASLTTHVFEYCIFSRHRRPILPISATQHYLITNTSFGHALLLCTHENAEEGGKRTHVNFPLPRRTHERDDNKGRRTREALFLPSELNRH